MSKIKLFILAAIMLPALTGCFGLFAKKPTEDKNPLLATECPETLPELQNDTFGETVKKAVQWAGIYHSCRKAALTGEKK